VVQPHDMTRAGKELEAELDRVLPAAALTDQMSAIRCFDPELPRTPTASW